MILLHGALRTRFSLEPLARHLRAAGLTVHNLGYASVARPVEAHGRWLAQELPRRVPAGARVGIVTHSLGALVARAALTFEPGLAVRVERLVMLAPPSRGARLARLIRNSRFFAPLSGFHLIERLQPGDDGFHRRLGVPPVPFGIVIGLKGDGRGYNPLIEGDNDGLVSEDDALLPGAADVLRVRRLHTFIMWAPEVQAGVLQFLRHARFAP